nr:alpha-galactosidase [Lactiplantibacillus plantarum]
MGINEYNFDWRLAAGDSFQTPEVAMVYSTTGLNGTSQTHHDLLRDRGGTQSLQARSPADLDQQLGSYLL